MTGKIENYTRALEANQALSGKVEASEEVPSAISSAGFASLWRRDRSAWEGIISDKLSEARNAKAKAEAFLEATSMMQVAIYDLVCEFGYFTCVGEN